MTFTFGFFSVPVRFFLGPLSLVDHHSGQRKVLGGNNEVAKKTYRYV